jgi:hypothetical protein
VRDNSMLFSIQTFSMGFGMERVVRSCPGVVESGLLVICCVQVNISYRVLKFA